MRRDSLFSIPPDAPFLATLADRVLDGTLLGNWPRSGPFWLSDVTIILPTRRARLKLAEIFADRLGGVTLLPDIRTLGGEQAEEEPFLPPFTAPVALNPVPPLKRMLTLARLVDAWARTPAGREVLATPPHAAEIFGLAQSLGTVLDDLVIEGGSLKPLDDAIGKLDLADNWRQTKDFLDIAIEAWPRIAEGHGLADAAVLRNDRLRRQAEAAPLLWGERPVIAAGSTGSMPATADLLAAIARLPRGVLVLPGLDTSLSAEAFKQLLDLKRQPQGHPQYGLARLLRHLGAAPAKVRELTDAGSARTALVHSALALAESTANWAAERIGWSEQVPAALADVSVIAARTVDEEARAIAMAARSALEAGETVGIVSPDQTLSRRIAEELKRFDIDVDDAAGTPLFQAPAGRLARLVLAAAGSDFAAVDLMALLQNRALSLGLERSEVARAARLIDLGLLRGQRPALGIASLKSLLAANIDKSLSYPARRLTPADGELVGEVLHRLDAAVQPLCELLKRPAVTATGLAGAVMAATEALIEGTPAAGMPPGLDQLRKWAEELGEADGDGPGFGPIALDAVLAALMAEFKVTSPLPRRSDIAILGRLEARLMSPDLMILAGLNEEIWPEPADPGPWLSRGMRLAAGLEAPERQQGQAAHDFQMALGNHKVVLAFAERRGTAPALPSRLVQRLEAFVGKAAKNEMRARGGHWITLARALDLVDAPPRPAVRPAQRPPAAVRPRKLSVTEVETLFRSPYDIYAKHVLKLRKLAALGNVPDARERGSMIHEVFDRFVREGHAFAAPDSHRTLMRMAEHAFAGLEAIGERRDIWLKRFERAAAEFLTYEASRDPLVGQRHAEISGEWAMPIGFTLTGKADRIDELKDGTLEILDFKTGSIPTAKAMKAFEAPQLLLEAAMARAGAFGRVAAAETSALTYIKIGLGPDAMLSIPFRQRDGLDLPAAADEVARRLQGHVEALLLKDDLPMAARIRPDIGRRYRGDYDHLARTDEWTIAAGEDE